jgi:hypothetical protein
VGGLSQFGSDSGLQSSALFLPGSVTPATSLTRPSGGLDPGLGPAPPWGPPGCVWSLAGCGGAGRKPAGTPGSAPRNLEEAAPALTWASRCPCRGRPQKPGRQLGDTEAPRATLAVPAGVWGGRGLPLSSPVTAGTEGQRDVQCNV